MKYTYTELEKEKVLSTFMREGIVIQIPSSVKKKYILLKEIILSKFKVAQIYYEKEINEKLQEVRK